MKRARPIKDEASAPGTGARIIATGGYPAKLATVTAEVLARLLAGIEAHRLASGGWLVHRWNLHRELASDDELDAWLSRIGGRP